MTRARPVRIGIAGGIGSGKSTVARLFGELGCVVIDSDALSRAAINEPAVMEQLVDWWGPSVVTGTGVVDRQAVGRIVFADSSERARLEGLIHPMIESARMALIEVATTAGVRAVLIDAPLLFEAGLAGEMDAIVFVDTPFEARLERVRGSRGWSEQELRDREKAQLPLEEKRRRSDYHIVNTGGVDDLRRQVTRILTQITEAQTRD